MENKVFHGNAEENQPLTTKRSFEDADLNKSNGSDEDVEELSLRTPKK